MNLSEGLPKLRLLAASAVAVSCPADTTEDILATIAIPAGAMGLNGVLRAYTLWSMTGSTNFKTVRVRLGGIGGTAFRAVAINTGAVVSYMDEAWIANRGAANSQVAFQSGSTGQATSNAANATGAIDTAAATTLVITGQKASSGETLTLESYLVELLVP